MTDTAVHSEGLGKRYRIGAQPERYKTLRDQLSFKGAAAVVQRLIGRRATTEHGAPDRNHVWALRGLSFTIRRGEAVGVIGRNGAGKSTLLKILSRVTDPTEGQAEIHGRVASMLEVGTGFHPELTGRENVYLNAAILGMRRAEIERKFGQIVAFAEVERFLETPVKHYSSGMYVRLAFAVAAHLEPDILLIDEVLAVGDLAFRDKCFRHMRSLRDAGVTILLVSHYLAQVAALTRRTLWLDAGKLRMDDQTGAVVAAYSNELLSGGSSSTGRQTSTGRIEIAYVRSLDEGRRPCARFEMGRDVLFEIGLHVREPVTPTQIGLSIYTPDGVKVLLQNTMRQGLADLDLSRDCIVRLLLPKPPLLAGSYDVTLSVGTAESNSANLAEWPNCCRFSVLAPPVAESAHLTYAEPFNGTGLFRWEGKWEVLATAGVEAP